MGCHSECDTYKNELAEHEKQKAQVKTEQTYYAYARSSAAKNMDIIAKKRKRQHGYGKNARR